MRALVSLIAVVVSGVTACGPAIDCKRLEADACREATAQALVAAERQRPGVGIRSVSLGAVGVFSAEYADGTAIWMGQ